MLGCEQGRAAVVVGDVCRLAKSGRLPGAPFRLVVLDPPYAMDASRVCELVADLDANALLAEDARILYEHDSKAPGLDVPGFAQAREKSHGITTFEILTRGA